MSASSSVTSENYDKLKVLLRELFQFDCADLDFGIYRIMNQKRDEVEKFLDKDLFPQVREEFEKYGAGDRSRKEDDLKKLEASLRDAGVDPFTSPKYVGLQNEISQIGNVEALEAEVYSDLYNFFRRYYKDGDFLSLPRYKEGVYAIPYNGEEVKLHWANSDQYYVKTSEYFKDYAFRLPSDRRVHFTIIDALTEQNNNKAQEGKERRFILYGNEPVYEKDSELFIRFEYKAPEEAAKQQDLNNEAVKTIFGVKGFEGWTRELRQVVDAEKGTTLLERHLRKYSARNTFDYFIHKDLRRFLERELDFYIKNELMHVDDLDTENEIRVDRYLSKIKVIKRIAQKIILFLAQIEDFQKKLWLKKKFVVETNYCITLDRVPEELYPEIIKNKEQIEEWKRLYAIEEIQSNLSNPGYTEPLKKEFLKENPYLVLDTKFFNGKFKNMLQSSFDDIDSMTNGLLVHGENFQTLNTLQGRYGERIKCIYIDPPYNTGKDEFCYRDNYQHSSWLSMMESRLALSRDILCDEGVIFTSIDDGEQSILRQLEEDVFGKYNFVSNIIWQKKFSPQNDAKWLSDNHDFIICFTKDKEEWHPELLPRTKEQDLLYKNLDNDERGPWSSSDLSVKTYSAAYDYPITTPSGRIVNPPKGTCWRIPIEKFNELVKDNRIWFGASGDNVPRLKRFLSDVKQGITPLTVWTYEEVGHNQEGKQELIAMLSDSDVIFSTPKVVRLLKRVFTIGSNKESYILDYFAGSGTSGHAIISLNREDKGNRKYILVEMADYFDTVLKPRVQKVIYSKDWKDGKPVSREGSSHMFKYLRLESYEDALNNIELKSEAGQQQTLDKVMSKNAKEEYMLGYMLDVESRGSASLLNVTAFDNPFEYKMKIANGTETEERNVDLVETFNYLLGLTVRTIKAQDGVRIVTGELPGGQKALVIWRNVFEYPNDVLDKLFVEKGFDKAGYDYVYVNGDNTLERLKPKGAMWTVTVIEGEFMKRMFDVQDV